MRAGPAFDIASLHAAYQDGFTADDMIDTVFARIAKVNDPGIFIHLADNGDLLAQAEALGVFDPVTKPLWGIPFAVKGNIDVAGMPTTAACPDYSYVSEADATVVRLLRQAVHLSSARPTSTSSRPVLSARPEISNGLCHGFEGVRECWRGDETRS